MLSHRSTATATTKPTQKDNKVTEGSQRAALFRVQHPSCAQLLRASPELGRRALRLSVAQGKHSSQPEWCVTWRVQQKVKESEGLT